MTAAASSISRPPGKFFTEDLDLVPTMIHAATTTAIRVHPLRRNIAILEGSGGNIAVLTGEDGKLLVAPVSRYLRREYRLRSIYQPEPYPARDQQPPGTPTLQMA